MFNWSVKLNEIIIINCIEFFTSYIFVLLIERERFNWTMKLILLTIGFN